jgi:predicted transporter
MDFKQVFNMLVGTLVRHGMTLLAGIFAAKGWISANEVEQMVTAGSAAILSGVLFIAGIVLSAVTKTKAINAPPPSK